MKINEIGGEFSLIERVTRGRSAPPEVIKGIGDDCAVLEWDDNHYLLVTTDMMVENDHFNLSWHTPYQVGRKLMEANVSDIVCKGGTPLYAFLSISLTKDTTVELMDGFYKGLYDSADRHGVHLLGGDTTHGQEHVFNITLMGKVAKEVLPLRSGAKVGDLVCVTGITGGSTAGLKLLIHKKEGYLKDHLEPCCRTVEEGRAIAAYATAAIDVSDGLGSELTHICQKSGTGGVLYYEKIPLSPETRASARTLGADPADWALYGGEDFEILFTLPPEKVEDLKGVFWDFTVIGEILPPEEGIGLLKAGKKEAFKKGFDHFA